MKREDMIVACCNDLAGKTRGKAFPATQFEKRLRRGVGWTPTNVQITCFDTIAESPFGALGDLVLIPAPETRVSIESPDKAPAGQFVLGNIRYTDGRAWEFCTRSILEDALSRFKRVAGVTVRGAFEHEFQFCDSGVGGGAFTLSGLWAEKHFCEAALAALRMANIPPDTILKEFGRDQFEVTVEPRQGVTIADHAVIAREVLCMVARDLFRSLTFTPIRNPSGVGNGVHIHMSFWNEDGTACTWDPTGRHELSPLTGSFIAGILKYLPAIIAITAPSVVSYLRLMPHRWSAAFNNLGLRDREAAVRICPVSDMSDIAKAAQFHFEFRAADATASPYLQFAALVHAGVQGIEENLPVPDTTQEDLSLLDGEALSAKGYARLPQSLDEALTHFQTNATVTGWFPKGFADVYVAHKRHEIAHLAGRDNAAICAAYEAVY